jgi:hypothetical protein
MGRLANGATKIGSMTMSETRAVKDLAIGELIQVDGFDGDVTVRSARRITKGLDAGKLQVALVTANGEKEVVAFNPEDLVQVVGTSTEGAAKAKAGGPGAAKGKGKAKGKTKSKAQASTETRATTPASQSQVVETSASAGTAEPQAQRPKKGRAPKKAEGGKKLSALDAAAQVLAEGGTALNCQELIQAMADKGLWVSPGGKTPAATLYSAILRELQTKGDLARFRKTERGKFAAANSKS